MVCKISHLLGCYYRLTKFAHVQFSFKLIENDAEFSLTSNILTRQLELE